MAISGVGSSGYSNYGSYSQIASGNRINSAADDAAGLAISEQMKRQETGLSVGANNQASARDLLNVQDSALGSITENLQRMRELALQAQNTVSYTDKDRANMQTEIDQLKQEIERTANDTTFNTKNILNGTLGDLQIATDSNGNGTSVSTGNATLKALGIDGFDVTKNAFDIGSIDKALESVTSMRADGGAQTNRLEYGMNYNRYSSQLTTGSRSRISDLDIPSAISERKKQDTINQYQMMMQRRKQEDAQNSARRLFGGI